MSTSDTTNALLTANDQLATFLTLGRGKTAEGGLEFPRGSSYGEAMVQSVFGARAVASPLEGSYWTASNVPGTPITNGIITGFVATTPTLVLFNSNSVASNKYILPVRYKCQKVAAGASSTDYQGQWIIDTGNRWTSGGTLLTAANVNLNVLNTATGAVIHQGAITAPAANASRIIHAQKYRSVIPVASDRYTFEFATTPVTQGMPLEGTLQVDMVINVPLPPIPPQCSLLWYAYGSSMGTADSLDFSTFEYVER